MQRAPPPPPPKAPQRPVHVALPNLGAPPPAGSWLVNNALLIPNQAESGDQTPTEPPTHPVRPAPLSF